MSVAALAAIAATRRLPPPPADDGMTLNVVGACPDAAAVRRVLVGP